MPPYRLALLASGNGTNAEEIFRYFNGSPTIGVSVLLSNNPNAYALERARKFTIPSRTFTKAQLRDPGEVSEWLKEFDVSHIVLAGFLWLIPEHLIDTYPNHIINIHPALLPKYGGKGMYGMKVHEAVKANKDKETGITIHLVNNQYDEGKVIFQEHITVDAEDSPELIAEKVHALEYKHYPRVIERWVLGGFK